MKTRTLQHPSVGDWELAQSLLAEQTDAYVMHGADADRVERQAPHAPQRSETARAEGEAESAEPMWVLPW